MKRKSLIILIVSHVAAAFIFGMVGYLLGQFFGGIKHTNETMVRSYTNILFLNSTSLNRHLEGKPTLEELIEYIESSNEWIASFVQTNITYAKMLYSEENLEKMDEAVNSWNKTKSRLDEIKNSLKKT